MQIAEDSTFGYTSAYWTNDALLNENALPDDNVNAKFATFLNASFNQIRMCSRTNCLSYSFKNTWDSAKQLFNSGFQRAADQDQDKLLAVFDPYKEDYRVRLLKHFACIENTSTFLRSYYDSLLGMWNAAPRF